MQISKEHKLITYDEEITFAPACGTFLSHHLVYIYVGKKLEKVGLETDGIQTVASCTYFKRAKFYAYWSL
ncbi:MAG: hypothetical protein KDD53_09700 [Bdellovibrionales bacterium]|nr:hypothetical protein [Bdellovibrionales bacterium]